MPNISTKLTVDTAQVKNNLNSVRGFVAGWARDVRGQIAGAFAAGSVVAAAKETADRLSSIEDAAGRVDYSVEAMQALELMASQANLELAQTEKLLNSLSDAQISIATQSKPENVDAAARLGITPAMANQMTPQQFMQSVVKGLNNNNINGRQSIQNALPFLNSKSAGVLNALMEDLTIFDDYINEKISEGAIVNDKTISESKKSSDELAISWRKLMNSLEPLIRKSVELTTVFVKLIGGLRLLGPLLGISAAKTWDGLTDWFKYVKSNGKEYDVKAAELREDEYDRQARQLYSGITDSIKRLFGFGEPAKTTLKPSAPNLPINNNQPITTANVSGLGEGLKEFIKNIWNSLGGGIQLNSDLKRTPRSIYTDELLGKGNMLGQSRGSVHVQTAFETIRLQKQILDQNKLQVEWTQKTFETLSKIEQGINLFTTIVP